MHCILLHFLLSLVGSDRKVIERILRLQRTSARVKGGHYGIQIQMLDIHSLFGTISCKRGAKTLSSAKYYHKPSHCNSILGMRLAPYTGAGLGCTYYWTQDWGINWDWDRHTIKTLVGISLSLELGLVFNRHTTGTKVGTNLLLRLGLGLVYHRD